MCGFDPRWTFDEVRRAALALSRAIERRAPTLASSKWWKEERHGVFLDYNQNAKDRTTCSAYSVRPVPDARVSAPLHWREVPDCEPADFTVLTMPKRFAQLGDRTRASMVHPVRWKNCSSSPRRTRPPASATHHGLRTSARWRVNRVALPLAREIRIQVGRKNLALKMPLLVVANSPNRDAALAGLERWKKYPEAAKLLAVDDVLVDSMRGRLSTWTRIRVNLRHVPEELRPPQETPDPDDDPTREWRSMRARKDDP